MLVTYSTNSKKKFYFTKKTSVIEKNIFLPSNK